MNPETTSSMLFCPPLPPLRLTATVSAIGRHSSCDLVLRKDDISRRHAEVLLDGSQWVLRDLGSTNGTFVNGHRVQGTAVLRPGDRIELGSSTITFCQVDGEISAGEDEPSAAKTMIVERLPETSSEAFQGDLAEIPPDALLQLLEMGRKSGLLELTLPDGPGHLWLETGAPIHAETEKEMGFDAAVSMVGCTRGRFRFEPQVGCQERTIIASVTELLLEASRLHDESNRL